MSIIQTIIGTNLTISGGEPPPPPPPVVQGQFLYDGSYVNYGYYGPNLSAPTYNANVNFASTNSTGTYHAFFGDSYMMTSSLSGLTTTIYMNIWFYPTATNKIVMTINGVPAENSAYHCTLFEINALQNPVVGFWNQHVSGGGSGGMTIPETVNLNTWNHLYLFNNGTITSACLNGGNTYTTPHAWLSNSPGAHFIGFGTLSVTNFNATARFQGRIGEFECSPTLIASNYELTKSQYQPSVALGLDAAYNPAYTSGDYVLADAQASLGYGANGLAIFQQEDITQGFLYNVGVGWTVDNGSGFTATILTRGEFGYAGAIRIDQTSWDPGPYTFAPPANIWRSTNETYRYATLFNTPTYTYGTPAYYTFDAVSLEYASSPNLGNLNRWTVEVWFRTSTLSLNGVTTMIIGNQYDNISKVNFSIGTNNSPTSYSINSGFFDGAWRTAGNLIPTMNTWYHVIATYDGNYVRQYVNGVQDGASLAYVGTPQSGGEVYVAKRWDLGATTDHFPGDIGQAAVYRGAMSADEINKRWLDTKSTYGL